MVALVVLIPFALVRLPTDRHLLRRDASRIAAFGVIAIAAVQLTFFYAICHIAIGTALLIQYSSPVAVVGWMWLRHRQVPSRKTVAGAVIVMAGLATMLGLTVDLDWIGGSFAFASMGCVACFYVMSNGSERELSGVGLSTGGLLSAALMLSVVGALGIIPTGTTTNHVVFVHFTVIWWQAILVLGVVSGAWAYLSAVQATRVLGPRSAAFAGQVDVLLAVAFAWVLLGDVPRIQQILGGMLIVAGVLLVGRGEWSSGE